MLIKKRKERPLLAAFRRMLVEPLSIDASIELAMGIRKGISSDSARTIAEISGGEYHQ